MKSLTYFGLGKFAVGRLRPVKWKLVIHDFSGATPTSRVQLR
jgi:hypothetical protein